MDDAITGISAAAERRAATDRRAFGWRTVFFGFLRSRRRSPRRGDEDDVVFLDWHHPWLFFLAVGIMLLSTADACCYSAKEEGRNRIHHADYDPDQVERRSGEMRWVNRISDAVQHERFILFGQMITPMHPELDDGRLALEVLLRMQDDGGLGMIAPGQFLPAAERYQGAHHVGRKDAPACWPMALFTEPAFDHHV